MPETSSIVRTPSGKLTEERTRNMPEPHLVPRVVSDRVNSVRNKGPELIEPATDDGRPWGEKPRDKIERERSRNLR
ncbi:hypothetical protein AB6813_03250 [bacterium RCC_150]